ncbi:hypothetical protein BD31_I1812 [Candidatus Nitrosopumilus salaria BD31]|uniref:Uncharacterized protein n=1 Tax=Candidatus Nitrosopumilus salarius BD31 TaxID=859350 RepID=I3D3K8_9ARCH|nr:hypothetical protein BD31_I1812 [Candidatus Nitrosopumilus salaria BD31]
MQLSQDTGSVFGLFSHALAFPDFSHPLFPLFFFSSGLSANTVGETVPTTMMTVINAIAKIISVLFMNL